MPAFDFFICFLYTACRRMVSSAQKSRHSNVNRHGTTDGSRETRNSKADSRHCARVIRIPQPCTEETETTTYQHKNDGVTHLEENMKFVHTAICWKRFAKDTELNVHRWSAYACKFVSATCLRRQTPSGPRVVLVSVIQCAFNGARRDSANLRCPVI